MGPTRY